MATATQLSSPSSPAVTGTAGRDQYRCDCGHALRVSGLGRHRIYFPLDNADLNDPVMTGLCPACGRGLPGKNS